MKKKIFLTTILVLALNLTAFSQNKPFVPVDFKVPDTLKNEYFKIRMITINDAVKDYDAVMTSIDHLRGVFGPESKWPSKNLTLMEDMVALGWHQKEFQLRSSFTYTVVRLDESEAIGSVYIFPANKDGYDAEVTMWVRSSVFKEGLDNILFNTVKQWIKTKWPFKKVAYPGREIKWSEWL